MRFLVRIYRYGGNYSALVPDLPGCVAAADTVEEVRKLVKEAIALHVEAMQEAGQKVPKPRQSMKFAIDQSSEEEFCTWVDVALPEPATR
jgi:predicted RNase H-like HicB family nuclease